MCAWYLMLILIITTHQQCGEGCINCLTDLGICSECSDGYALASGWYCCAIMHDLFPSSQGCQPCEIAHPGCLKCRYTPTQTLCDECSSEYELSDSVCCLKNNDGPILLGTCTGCHEGCLSCNYDGSYITCKTCDEQSGYYLTSNSCCRQGSYGAYAGGCWTCQDLFEGCASCYQYGSSVRCDTCMDSYVKSGPYCCAIQENIFPYSDRCLSCEDIIPGCVSCTYENDQIKCIACEFGFELVDPLLCQSTIVCPDGCLSCEYDTFAQVICRECYEGRGFYLANGQCCDIFQGQMISADGCVGCQYFYPHCIQCIQHPSTQQVFCRDCEEGFVASPFLEGCCPDSNPECSECAVGCKVCSDENPDVCLLCDSENGYIFLNGQCCDTSTNVCCTENCGYCVGEYCLSCNYPYRKMGDSCCNADQGFYLRPFDPFGDCQACEVLIQGCLVCSYELTVDQTVCALCNTKQVPSQFACCHEVYDFFPKCSTCSPECIICNNGRCEQCISSFQLSNDGECCSILDANGMCTSCQASLQGCLVCHHAVQNAPTSAEEGELLCIICDYDNYFRASGDGRCCDMKAGMYPISYGGCDICSNIHEGCSSCDVINGVTHCIECENGISVDGHCCLADDFECMGCPENCLQCTPDIGCTSCYPFHYLMYDECLPCGVEMYGDGECINCDGTSNIHCSECDEVYGYALQGGACVFVGYDDTEVPSIPEASECTVQNCAVCKDQYNCERCTSDYVLDETTNTCKSITTLASTIVCGNYYELSQGCDDGNAVGGDGCSSTCTVEDGYYCRNFIGFVSDCSDNCGNGQIEAGEMCDDGNTRNFDGCSSACSIEEGFNCASGTCLRLCGNGEINSGESCDDGNRFGGDGCNSACQVESGWNCSLGYCAPICGDGIKLGGESCDDGNTNNQDGCSFVCQEEGGWHCEGKQGEKSVCRPFEDFCGNKVYEFWHGERCDDGNKVSGDGCSSGCVIEDGWRCDTALIPNKCSRCGNGRADPGEQCDDGNLLSGDSCSSQCQVEDGYVCSSFFPSVCTFVQPCHDGSFDPLTEQCDDGNPFDRDGCNKQCQIEDGWRCTSPIGGSSSCFVIPVCGNGAYEPEIGEFCDDGNKDSNDGCSSTCRIEDFFQCSNVVHQQSVCTREYSCGNGLQEIENREECDDGNLFVNDGCDENCRIEADFTCALLRNGRSHCTFVASQVRAISGTNIINTARSVRTPRNSLVYECGNKVKEPGEDCDDGNQNSGDGCSSQCMVEAGYYCSEEMGCVRLCGNGHIDAVISQACDDGNSFDGDGCSSSCLVQEDWSCVVQSSGRSSCSRSCGDGKLDPLNEGCDDGNGASGDGCFNCNVQEGWTCSSIPQYISSCTAAQPTENLHKCFSILRSQPLSSAEISALRDSEFSTFQTSQDFVSELIEEDQNSNVELNEAKYIRARNLYYRQQLFHEWFMIDSKLRLCLEA